MQPIKNGGRADGLGGTSGADSPADTGDAAGDMQTLQQAGYLAQLGGPGDSAEGAGSPVTGGGPSSSDAGDRAAHGEVAAAEAKPAAFDGHAMS